MPKPKARASRRRSGRHRSSAVTWSASTKACPPPATGWAIAFPSTTPTPLPCCAGAASPESTRAPYRGISPMPSGSCRRRRSRRLRSGNESASIPTKASGGHPHLRQRPRAGRDAPGARHPGPCRHPRHLLCARLQARPARAPPPRPAAGPGEGDRRDPRDAGADRRAGAPGPAVPPVRGRRRAGPAPAQHGGDSGSREREDDLRALERDPPRLGRSARLGRGGAGSVPGAALDAARPARPPHRGHGKAQDLHRAGAGPRGPLPAGLPARMRADPARGSPRPAGALPRLGLGRVPAVGDPGDDLGRPEVIHHAALLIAALLLADALEGLADVGGRGVTVLELRVQDALETHATPQKDSLALLYRSYVLCGEVNVRQAFWQ